MSFEFHDGRLLHKLLQDNIWLSFHKTNHKKGTPDKYRMRIQKTRKSDRSGKSDP